MGLFRRPETDPSTESEAFSPPKPLFKSEPDAYQADYEATPLFEKTELRSSVSNFGTPSFDFISSLIETESIQKAVIYGTQSTIFDGTTWKRQPGFSSSSQCTRWVDDFCKRYSTDLQPVIGWQNTCQITIYRPPIVEPLPVVIIERCQTACQSLSDFFDSEGAGFRQYEWLLSQSHTPCRFWIQGHTATTQLILAHAIADAFSVSGCIVSRMGGFRPSERILTFSGSDTLFDRFIDRVSPNWVVATPADCARYHSPLIGWICIADGHTVDHDFDIILSDSGMVDQIRRVDPPPSGRIPN